MRRKQDVFYIFATLITFLVLGVGVYFECHLDELTEVKFSANSGFYENEFRLSLRGAKGATIYYTTDGSDPDSSSLKYEGPILIYDRTADANVYSMNTNVSTSFFLEDVEKYSPSNKMMYSLPDSLVDKCTVIKAIQVRDGESSAISCRSFFVGVPEKEYDNIYIMSLTTDPSNLFDYNEGIYVTGVTYDEYRKTTNLSSWMDGNWRLWPANYMQKWDRPAKVEIFNPHRKRVLAADFLISIKGGGSRAFLPRSLNFEVAEPQTSLRDTLFKQKDSFSSFSMFAGGNEKYYNAKDFIGNAICNKFMPDVASMIFLPCVMFVDGEYWGFYWLTERYDKLFFANTYDLKRDNIEIYKYGHEKNSLDKLELDNFVQSLDMDDEKSFDRLSEVIDIQSCADYYALGIYLARTNDWPQSNYLIWRSINSDPSSKYGDCRWRWAIFDLNSTSMEVSMSNTDSLEYVSQNDEFFSKLMENDEFSKKLHERLRYLAEVLTEEYIDSVVNDCYRKSHDQIVYKHYYRFFSTATANGLGEKFDSYFEDTKRFFEERSVYVLYQY